MRKNSSAGGIALELGTLPLIEMTGNRRVNIEGSTGVLLYDSECVKINTAKTVISVSGRGLYLRCISPTCVEIEGFITNVGFLC